MLCRITDAPQDCQVCSCAVVQQYPQQRRLFASTLSVRVEGLATIRNMHVQCILDTVSLWSSLVFTTFYNVLNDNGWKQNVQQYTYHLYNTYGNIVYAARNKVRFSLSEIFIGLEPGDLYSLALVACLRANLAWHTLGNCRGIRGKRHTFSVRYCTWDLACNSTVWLSCQLLLLGQSDRLPWAPAPPWVHPRSGAGPPSQYWYKQYRDGGGE